MYGKKPQASIYNLNTKNEYELKLAISRMMLDKLSKKTEKMSKEIIDGVKKTKQIK